MIKNKVHLQVELTNYCNLACVECPHRLMKRPLQHMEEDVFRRLVDYIFGLQPQTLIPHKDGEPLLHPRFKEYLFRMIDAAPYSKIDIYTNGHLLEEELFVDIVRRVVGKPNKVWFLVSFHRHKYDGREYNIEGPTTKVLKCLELLKKYGIQNVEFVITSHKTDLVTQDQMKEWYAFWDRVRSGTNRIYDIHANTAINPWAGKIKQDGAIHFVEGCPYRFADHIFVGVTGNVLPCCIDLEEEIVFGNIMEDDFDAIMDRRSDFYTNEKNEELCRKCLS